MPTPANTPQIGSERNPWVWVPSLYFAQGIPYVIAMIVSVVMYKRMGISNTDIALYTSWLYLPWVIKPLWSPFVDMFKTKRLWVLSMQMVIGASLAGVALTIPLPHFFQYTLAILWLVAFSSATHDIAADGFYMLGLDQHEQAAFVGVRSTFYRIAMISGQGLLVMLAGFIESSGGLPPVNLNVTASPDAANAPFVYATTAPAAVADQPLAVVAEPAELTISTTARSKEEIAAMQAKVKASNEQNGFVAKETEKAKEEPSWWTRTVSEPMAGYLRSHFGEQKAKGGQTGNVGVAMLHLSSKPEAGREVAVVLDRTKGDNSIEIIQGARLAFNENNWDKPAMVMFRLDPMLKTQAQATFTGKSGNIPFAWTTVFIILAAFFAISVVYHKFMLPRPVSDRPAASGGVNSIVTNFIRTFSLFFSKKNIVMIMAFLLLYRFAEAQLVKLITPFLLDSREAGGLGLTTSMVGFAYGTVGVAGLMVGGLLGGYVVSRQGLKFWIKPMVLIINLGGLMYIFLSQVQPHSFAVVCGAVGVEQFGYGFGFTAYMLFMIYAAEGEHKTAHYALCTGFMALGMMVPGMFSGWLEDIIGYQHFFIWVLLSTIPSLLVAFTVKVPAGFGVKQPKAAVAAAEAQAEEAPAAG